MPAVTAEQDDLFPSFEGKVHFPLFPSLVFVFVGGKSGISRAAALLLSFVEIGQGGHFHGEVPHIVGENELGEPLVLFYFFNPSKQEFRFPVIV